MSWPPFGRRTELIRGSVSSESKRKQWNVAADSLNVQKLKRRVEWISNPESTPAHRATMEFTYRSSMMPTSLYSRQRRPQSRFHGLTEIRGPYYTVMGPHYLEDLLEAQGRFVDGLKFAGGSLGLMPRDRVKFIIGLAHKHGIYVSTGGWADDMLAKGPRFFNQYVNECKELGFDTVELSNEFLKLKEEDLMRLIRLVKNAGMKAKPEILFSEGRGITNKDADRGMHEDLELLIKRAERCIQGGADMIMIEADGLTQNVPLWRTDVLAEIVGRIGLERTMFEAHDPNILEYFVRNYGAKVNLYVNHSDAAQLERLRSGTFDPNLLQGGILI